MEVEEMKVEEKEEIKSFKDLGLCDELVEACDRLSWKTPTKIQVEAIPHALKGKDLIGLADIGSGKTGAFALPILHALLECHSKQEYESVPVCFALVLAPYRFVAIEISEQFEALGHGFGLKCAVLAEGEDLMKQQIALGNQPHIIVATPGGLVDHLTNTKGFSLSMLKYLVLATADLFVKKGFRKTLVDILNFIPRNRHTYLFSPTMTNKVEKLRRACLRNPVKIEIPSKYNEADIDPLMEQYAFYWYRTGGRTIFPFVQELKEIGGPRNWKRRAADDDNEEDILGVKGEPDNKKVK